ncbi:MAG: DUF4214 domain-containing protein [Acidobacteriota bacterium]
MSLFSIKRIRSLSLWRLRPVRDFGVFLAMSGLTALMTWPWILNIRDALSDRGDSYTHSYWVWWGGYQLFNDPLNLFNSTLFFPYKNTLAFSENDFGIALIFAPLQLLGFRPVTVVSIATLFAYAFSGYAMFRLTRTLTNSSASAWIAGIVFAFIPYHFQRLPHLATISAGWVPLTLEAVVLFARQRTWRRAAWVSVTFTMNALTCVSLFILTLIPFGLSALILVGWYQAWRDRRFWIRGGLLFGAAAVAVSLFLYPYYQVSQMYGFARKAEDAILLSALPIHWLAASERNKIWKGLGGKAAIDELMLFPGLLSPLLGLAAFFLVKPLADQHQAFKEKAARLLTRYRILVMSLDLVAVALLLLALLTAGYGEVQLGTFGSTPVRLTSPILPLGLFLIVLGIRFWLAYPILIQRLVQQKRLVRTFFSNPRSLALTIATTWLVTGFFGSFGMNFFFHRLLFEYVLVFRSLRAPVRWAMVCYVGLSILAGIGAVRVLELAARWIPRVPRFAVCIVLAVFILFELRVAPIQFAHGEVDPDAITLRLRDTPMAGGIVELPAEKDNYAYYRYHVRAADHRRPIVTAHTSFAPPIVQEIEGLTAARPIPDSFLDLLEKIPTSYLVVHNGLLKPESQEAIESLVERGLASGRLRFVNSFGDPNAPDDLYAVTKIEPDAKQEVTRRTRITFVRRQYVDLLAREPERGETEAWDQNVRACGNDASCVLGVRIKQNSDLLHSREFHEIGVFVYRLYRTLGRAPTYSEWERDRRRLLTMNAQTLAAEWVASQGFLDRYPVSLTNSEYVDKLIQAVGPLKDPAAREPVLERLRQEKIDRAAALAEVINNGDSLIQDDASFVTLCYFVFLKRDPDNEGLSHWVRTLNKDPQGETAVILGFLNSPEYRVR